MVVIPLLSSEVKLGIIMDKEKIQDSSTKEQKRLWMYGRT